MKSQRITPQWLIDEMWEITHYHETYSKPLNILEPSAGIGDLLNSHNNLYLDIFDNQIDCIELNQDKCTVLKNKGYNVIHGDFLKLDITKKI
jgi:16S rRNA A1518/A1519 N6-dimethyltransferase RsmA/KsgA/DIM1 with predicted DNA glycosylase/AP lyase activity